MSYPFVYISSFSAFSYFLLLSFVGRILNVPDKYYFPQDPGFVLTLIHTHTLLCISGRFSGASAARNRTEFSSSSSMRICKTYLLPHFAKLSFLLQEMREAQDKIAALRKENERLRQQELKYDGLDADLTFNDNGKALHFVSVCLCLFEVNEMKLLL